MMSKIFGYQDEVPAEPLLREHQDHTGQSVSVGGFQLFLGGAMYRPFMNLSGYDVVVPFLEIGHPALEKVSESVKTAGKPVVVRHYPILDFSGVPDDWTEFLASVVSELNRGSKVIAFCMGGHGRTGTFLASLITILEPGVEDPVAEARSRYCEHAVETRAQAEAVFALKGQSLPVRYKNPQ